MIKWVWWDCDGTIYRFPGKYEELKNKRRLELYSEITGKAQSKETWSEYCGLYEKLGSHSAVFVSLGKPKNFWRSDPTHNINLLEFLKRDEKTTQMFADFSHIAAQHGIFTNNTFSEVKRILKFLKVDHKLFKHILTIEGADEPKPDQAIFRKMLELSCVEPSEVLVVGDRVRTDLEPANKLGMKTCLVWHAKKPEWVDHVFSHVAEVMTLFNY